MVEPESMCVSRNPLKVIQQGPHKVTTHVGSLPSKVNGRRGMVGLVFSSKTRGKSS
jgi:hypothetical protein